MLLQIVMFCHFHCAQHPIQMSIKYKYFYFLIVIYGYSIKMIFSFTLILLLPFIESPQSALAQNILEFLLKLLVLLRLR